MESVTAHADALAGRPLATIAPLGDRHAQHLLSRRRRSVHQPAGASPAPAPPCSCRETAVAERRPDGHASGTTRCEGPRAVPSRHGLRPGRPESSCRGGRRPRKRVLRDLHGEIAAAAESDCDTEQRRGSTRRGRPKGAGRGRRVSAARRPASGRRPLLITYRSSSHSSHRDLRWQGPAGSAAARGSGQSPETC